VHSDTRAQQIIDRSAATTRECRRLGHTKSRHTTDRTIARRALLEGLVIVVLLAVTPAVSRADEIGYLVNMTVRPGYNFPNAQAALDYGYRLCDQIARGEGYPQLASQIRTDFATTDEFQVSYLLSQASQELCPQSISQLRQSAGGYRPPP
jgi:Protein of unknown function (DUF732)